MRKTRFSEEQIINILKGVEAGQRVADATKLTTLSEYSARVRSRLASFDFADKRLALEALGVKIQGNGRDWRLDVALPEAGFVPQSS